MTEKTEDPIIDPTCSNCLFRRESSGDGVGGTGPKRIECRFSHKHATGEVEATVRPDDACGDGGWMPRELGLENAPEHAVGYLIARVNVDLHRRERESSGVIVARRGLVTSDTLQ